MHAMKSGDTGFCGFGEAYFSWAENRAVKAWKQHRRMTLNLVVPVGEVRFVFCEEDSAAGCRQEIIGDSRYARLTVPPGIWFGFQGMVHPRSLVLNLADMAHDPEECFRKDRTEINFDWEV
jgi:dTDP-4-dehydrorhamnose 3,5-epimerase